MFSKQARNQGTAEKRIANSGGRTDETDGKIATDPIKCLPLVLLAILFHVFFMLEDS